MSHVSKQKIDKDVLSKINDQFINILAGLEHENSSKKLIKELFTKTEKLMLAKRLSAIVMLMDGYSQYYVWNLLNLSSSTVSRISRSLKKKEFSFIEKLFSDKKYRMNFINKVLYISRAGLPPRIGRGRWPAVYGEVHKYEDK